MSGPAPSQKLPANYHSTKPKVEPESHLTPSAAAKTESSGLVQDELLDAAPSSLLQPASSAMLHPSGGEVLSRESSSLAQRQYSTRNTASAKPLTASGFAGRNFASLPTRGSIQTKLTVGAAHDSYEEEADQVAEQVMRLPATTFTAPAGVDDPDEGGRSIQRSLEDEEELQAKPLTSTITPLAPRTPTPIDEDTVKQVVAEDEAQSGSLVQRAAEEEDDLQTKRVSAADSFETDDGFEGRVAATRGGGSPLPDPVRSFMEPRFGADFSSVRVHADSEAADLNQQVSAQAFTLGQDIYLGEGKTDVASESGKRLLAHELTHVVQQGGGGQTQHTVNRLIQRQEEAAPKSPEADANENKERIAHELAAIFAALAGSHATEKSHSTKETNVQRKVQISPAPAGIYRLPDLPDQQASADTYGYLKALEQVQHFPLYSCIMASPTLRPYTVEQAAANGTLTQFDKHPGSTFLGTVGEALVWRAWEYQHEGPASGWKSASTFVVPQPATVALQNIPGLKVPPEYEPLLTLIGETQPDLMVVLVGGEINILGVRVQQSPQLLNIVSTASATQIESQTFDAKTVIAFLEVTTTRRLEYLEPRAVKVAAWAKVLGAVGKKLPGVQVVAVLVVDRGAYFELTETERQALHKTVYSAGGYISVTRDLTKLSLEDARLATQDLAEVNR